MTTRSALILELRARLSRDSSPRLTVFVMLAFAGGVAFLSSVIALWAGVDSMGVRYGLAVIAGYVAFLFLIRAWIALHRGWLPDVDLPDVVDVTDVLPSPGGCEAPNVLGGSLDLDEFAWLLVAIVAALGGIICVGYVIYTAPLLLGEVALDAALVSAVYRRLRQEDVGHWTGAVVRRTWMPTVALLIFMSLMGFASQHAVPEARSIGAVIRALVS